MTDDLAETALTFCRETLRWESPCHVQNGDIGIVFKAEPPDERLHLTYTDLNAVMEAARRWAFSNHLQLRLLTGDFAGLSAYSVTVRKPTGIVDLAQCRDNDPCHALLAACVEANRKLKGVSNAT